MFGEERNQPADGTAEKIIQHGVHIAARIVVLRDDGVVFVGLAIGLVCDEALFFENADDGRNGIVGGFGFVHLVEDAVYDGGAPVPQYLHDLQFGTGQFLRSVLYYSCHNYTFS